MVVFLRVDGLSYALVRHTDREVEGTAKPLNPSSARDFLRRASVEIGVTRRLREALANELRSTNLTDRSDHEVLEQLAWRIGTGTLECRLLAPQPIAHAYIPFTDAPGRKPAPAKKPAPTKKPAPAPSPAPPPEEDEALANIDAEAQAATLRLAAEEGIPFCEECEKRAQAEEAAEAADEALANIDVAAQVATLERAAEEGIPFCEECEKSKE